MFLVNCTLNYVISQLYILVRIIVAAYPHLLHTQNLLCPNILMYSQITISCILNVYSSERRNCHYANEPNQPN